jgi:hypothetical protein
MIAVETLESADLESQRAELQARLRDDLDLPNGSQTQGIGSIHEGRSSPAEE